MSAPRRHLGWGAFTVAGGQIGVLFAAMVTSVVIARTEGPQGTGTFALVYTLVDVTVMVAGLGLSQGITYALSNRLWSLRTALRIAGLSTLVLGVTGALLALLAYVLGGDSFLDGLDVDDGAAHGGVDPVRDGRLVRGGHRARARPLRGL